MNSGWPLPTKLLNIYGFIAVLLYFGLVRAQASFVIWHWKHSGENFGQWDKWDWEAYLVWKSG